MCFQKTVQIVEMLGSIVFQMATNIIEAKKRILWFCKSANERILIGKSQLSGSRKK